VRKGGKEKRQAGGDFSRASISPSGVVARGNSTRREKSMAEREPALLKNVTWWGYSIHSNKARRWNCGRENQILGGGGTVSHECG